MARRRTLKWKLALLAVVIVLVGYAALWLSVLKEGRINPANYEQIRVGMTVNDVQAILGEGGVEFLDDWPPGREFLDTKAEGVLKEQPDDNEPRRMRTWYAQDTLILIQFGDDDRVTGAGLVSFQPLSFLERIRVILANQ